MRLPSALVVLLALSAGGHAQNPSSADEPANIATTAAAPATSQAQDPSPSSAQPPIIQGSASENGPEIATTLRSVQLVASSRGADVTIVSLNGPDSNTLPAQNTPIQSNTPQVSRSVVPGPSESAPDTQASAPAASGSLAFAPPAGASGTVAGAPHATGAPGLSGSNSTATGGLHGSDSDGGGINATISSPALATTASFAAQPSDSFKIVNSSSLEAMPESNKPTPPDVLTTDQFHAELTANIPDKAINEKTARDLAILETAYFEYFVNTDPAPVDIGKLSIPASISGCQNTYSQRLKKRTGFVERALSWVPLISRDLRGFGNCKAVDSLEVGVYFHYMRATAAADRPNELESRVKAQVDVLNEALGAVKINFRFMALNWWEPKANEDWTTITRREAKLREWQQRTRSPGKLVLTVWIVNGLRGDDKGELSSYATFPNEKLDDDDGIVIEEAHVQGGDAATLVHDVGHWLGLGHTFGGVGEQCLIQTGLTNATQTSGNRDVVYECSQVTCVGGPAVEINNYMSYSSCRGKSPKDGFTTDQKARMFANALQFRRGYESGECMPDGKAAVRKRSSMQDLLDGQCPDVNKQANILMNTPHSMATGVVDRAASKLWGAAAVVWMAFEFLL
ncbi:Extracellular metalloprotease-like protein 1 [Colletotrichum chlorophyti]|uniref:Extracellular metalloprotease-like protein 1 n=1 Tax=Colletotrichum chlorophyti TaxID=708187 RepID=A0A1Q8S5Y2_9PEZI|nr:Extracellular metalloprotease-like protein 1 [Colletotrichum chlorophyti]